MEKVMKSRKLAYAYIKRSQQPFCMRFDEGITLVAVNDMQKNISVDYKEWSGDENGKNHFVTSIGEGLELDIYKMNLEVLEET